MKHTKSLFQFLSLLCLLFLLSCEKKDVKIEKVHGWYAFNSSSPCEHGASSFHFVNKEIAYIGGYQGRIFKTTNGGRSWREKIVDAGRLHDIKFVNENHGCALERSKIFTSHDGGENWQLSFSEEGNNFKSLWLVNNNIGFVCGEYGVLLKSADGGLTWEKIETGTKECLYSIWFTNEQVGYIGGGNGFIFKTTDGGNSWESIQVLPGHDFGGISFPDTNLGVAMVSSYNTSLFSSLMKTSDGGLTWKLVDRNYDFVEVYFIDSNTGFAIEGKGSTVNAAILKTTDGGESWQQHRNVLKNISDIHFIDNQVGFILSGGNKDGIYMLKTENCGSQETE